MKYSYMPTSISRAQTKCEVYGADYFIDSDERTLDFRNQYGETFVLAPRKAVWLSLVITFIAGILIGRFI